MDDILHCPYFEKLVYFNYFSAFMFLISKIHCVFYFYCHNLEIAMQLRFLSILKQEYQQQTIDLTARTVLYDQFSQMTWVLKI